MEHMIELPSEANPLTAENLYRTLRSASSAYQLQIQTGAKQLQAWETVPGYYPLLQVSWIHIFRHQKLKNFRMSL